MVFDFVSIWFVLAFWFGLPLAIVFAAIIHSRNKRH